MKRIHQYLDDALARGLADNDSDIARKIGTTRAAVSSWRTGRRSPDDEQAVKLALLLGRDPGELLAECGAARAKTPATRKVWERMAARMASYGITALVLIMPIEKAKDARAYGVTDDIQRVPVFRRKKEEMIQKLKRLLQGYDGAHTKMTHECIAA